MTTRPLRRSLLAGWAPAALLSLALTPASADVADGDWFLHEFGELRSYHGAWLAVCDDAGAGACRVVQHLFDDPANADPFFGDARLSIEFSEDAVRIEHFRRGAPDTPLGPVSLEIGRRSWVLTPGRGVQGAGTAAGGSIAESFEIIEQGLADEIVAAMREGRRLRIGYQNAAGRTHDVFALRGFAAALRAIDALPAGR